ncbi:MAG TPA: V-type ATPase 116kDa subunit family protein [Candidatus Saccharimonadales bacterium]|nr:V-type ATPase 116kDa subunit family protein [Candidatus Saccharimonadales bacterium]
MSDSMFEFLYSERMSRVRIMVPSSLEGILIDVLYGLEIIDFRESNLRARDCPPPERLGELESLDSRITEMIRLLNPKKVERTRQLPVEEVVLKARMELDELEALPEAYREVGRLSDEERSPRYAESGARIGRYEKEIGKRKKRLDRMSEAHYSKLAGLHEMLSIEIGKENAYRFIKRTESTSIVEGWIPAKRKRELFWKLMGATDGACLMETVRTKELPPTYIRGAGIMKSFDYLVNMYSTPRSDEINPAWFLILSFPIAYGLMVSDVGYGIVSLVLAMIVARRTSPRKLFHNLANIWMLSSVFTILFGIFNNQYFGVPLDQYIFPFFHGFDWSHNILTVVSVSIVVGIFQISVGLLLGMVNSYNRRDVRSALFRFFMLLALISGTLTVVGLFGLLGGVATYDSAVVLAAAVLCMVVARPHSAGRLIDLVTYPLSYIRIMGFGIVSIVLASLIDSAFTPDLSSGVAIFALYVVIYVLLHLLNMALSTFEAGFQSFRLSFIEFFDEFYTGRGTRYKPFGYERVHTLE